MKKIYTLLSLLVFCICLTSCTSDSDTSTEQTGPLFVNNVTFSIGTNTPPGDIHNVTLFQPGNPTDPTGTSTRTFTIVDSVTLETITLAVLYPSSQSNINGTYVINESNPGMATHYALCYYDIQGGAHFGGQPAFASGSVTITDNGANNFKIVFNTAVLKDNAAPASTKTITGYCETAFYEI
jgi:uncharacterized protein YcfL